MLYLLLFDGFPFSFLTSCEPFVHFMMNDVFYEEEIMKWKSLKRMKNKKRVLMSEKNCEIFVKSFSYVLEVFIGLLELFLTEKSHEISQLTVLQQLVTTIFFLN